MFLPFLPLISGIVGFAAGYAIAAAVEYLNGPKIKDVECEKVGDDVQVGKKYYYN